MQASFFRWWDLSPEKRSEIRWLHRRALEYRNRFFPRTGRKYLRICSDLAWGDHVAGLFQFRPHRGSLDRAMEEAVTLSGGMAALKEHLAEDGWILPDSLTVELYSARPDYRTNPIWHETYSVTATFIDGSRSIIGFTTKMLAQEINYGG